MEIRRLLVIGASVLALSACTTVKQAWDDRQGAFTRNLPDLNDNDARQFAERQNNLWNCFVAMAQAGVAHDFRARDGLNSSYHNRDSKYDCANNGAVPNLVKSDQPALAGADASIPEAVVTPPARAVPDGETGGDTQEPGGAPTPIPAVGTAAPVPATPTDYPMERGTTFIASRYRPTTIAGDHPTYSEVVAAGINYVDVRCDRYMDALFHFNRIRETASREVQFAGAASAAALTILKASTELIGLAPLGIGFIDQTINNVGRGLLYDLPPHIVRQLVERQQDAYLKAVSKEYTSRPHAMQTIQGYASLCLPATIETEVNRAIAAAEYKPIAWENPLPRDKWPTEKDKDDGKPDSATTTEGTPPPNNIPSVEQTKVDDDD
jgi:hypothetical protein